MLFNGVAMPTSMRACTMALWTHTPSSLQRTFVKVDEVEGDESLGKTIM